MKMDYDPYFELIRLMKKPIALDLYCGLGGLSDGLALEGFQVLGVEIDKKIAKLYKHPVIVADVRTLDGKHFKDFDLIVGSPPCRDFSRMCDHGLRSDGTYWKWKIPKDPNRGLELVNAFLRIVKAADPKFWLMENVPYLEEYIGIKPKCVVRMSKTMVRGFWGEFPPFLVPTTNKRNMMDIQGPLRRWERARIPLPVARALGRAVGRAVRKDLSL